MCNSINSFNVVAEYNSILLILFSFFINSIVGAAVIVLVAEYACNEKNNKYDENDVGNGIAIFMTHSLPMRLKLIECRNVYITLSSSVHIDTQYARV